MPRLRRVEKTDHSCPTLRAGAAYTFGSKPGTEDRERHCWHSREADQAEPHALRDAPDSGRRASAHQAIPATDPEPPRCIEKGWLRETGNSVGHRGSPDWVHANRFELGSRRRSTLP